MNGNFVYEVTRDLTSHPFVGKLVRVRYSSEHIRWGGVIRILRIVDGFMQVQQYETNDFVATAGENVWIPTANVGYIEVIE